MLDRMLLSIAKWLLRIRVRRQWRDVERHIATCPRYRCRWQKEHGIPEDQDASLFCHQGGKVWERNWDMSYAAETLS